jgi:hypothetical protein
MDGSGAATAGIQAWADKRRLNFGRLAKACRTLFPEADLVADWNREVLPPITAASPQCCRSARNRERLQGVDYSPTVLDVGRRLYGLSPTFALR